MELKEILIGHCRKYPGLQPVDLIKLVYQNEFGCGHLLENEADSLARLIDEWDSVAPSRGDACDEIGNGLCRLHLSAAKANGLSPPTLNRFFVHTANTHSGTVPGFESKLALLSELCAGRILPFERGELARALAQYRRDGYPAVSHSGVYRRFYAPAYRVVRKAYCDYLPLFQSRLPPAGKQNPIIAIDGNAAAEKAALPTCIDGLRLQYRPNGSLFLPGISAPPGVSPRRAAMWTTSASMTRSSPDCAGSGSLPTACSIAGNGLFGRNTSKPQKMTVVEGRTACTRTSGIRTI